MIIRKCKIVNNTIIINAKKGSPDTTCSEPAVTIKTGDILEKKIWSTNSQINFRKSPKTWGQNNKPFKSYLKKTDRRAGRWGGGGGCYKPCY